MHGRILWTISHFINTVYLGLMSVSSFYISIWNISYTLLSSLDSVLEIKDIAVMMIFPYFLESHVTEAFPSLKLMDYKVNINVRSPSSHVPPT